MKSKVTMKRTSIIIFAFIPYQTIGTSETMAKLSHHTRQYNPLSKEATCYTPLSIADSDNDGQLSEEEYAQFISEMNGDDTVQNYVDLAFELQVTFVYLDCLCGSSEDGNCCDGYIDISGTNSGTPTNAEVAHLDQICEKTQSTMDDISPSNENVPTMKPVEITTASPSALPTEAPITSMPSFQPSISPIKTPTISPTQLSTDLPSLNPSTLSETPSSRPTYFPSQASVRKPTTSPTYFESNKPSENPSVLSSMNPSTTPSLERTNLSTRSPISIPTISPIQVQTSSPSSYPTTTSPSASPSIRPSLEPTSFPSVAPKSKPTISPSISPVISISTASPTERPSSMPTLEFIPTPTQENATTLPPSFSKVSMQPTSMSSPSPASFSTSSPSINATLAPTSNNYAHMSGKPIISIHETSEPPSQLPSTYNSSIEYSEVDSVEKGGGTEDDSLNAGVIFGVLFPLVVVIAASAFALASKKKKREEMAKALEFQELEDNYSDEEVGGSSANRDPEDDDSNAQNSDIANLDVESMIEANKELSSNLIIYKSDRTDSGFPCASIINEKYPLKAELDNSNASREETSHSLSPSPPSSGDMIMRTTKSSGTESLDEKDVVNESSSATKAQNKSDNTVNTEETLSRSTTMKRNNKNRFYSDERTNINESNENSAGFESKTVSTELGDQMTAIELEDLQLESKNESTDKSIKEEDTNSRSKIEALVLRLIPNEIDNIDVMITQFDGREDQLISVLETMEEQRNTKELVKLASHADISASNNLPNHLNLRHAVERRDWHAVGQAAAIIGKDFSAYECAVDEPRTLHLDMEERIKQLDKLIDNGDWIGIVTIAGQYEAMDNDLDSSNDDSKLHAATGSVSDTSSLSAMPTYSALKDAIEKGSWHAVGQAAAIMGREAAQKNQSTDDVVSSASSAASYSSHSTLHVDKDDRIKHLDDLIARGDWVGIVVVAGHYQAMDEDLGLRSSHAH